ncbi:MAG: hypothetical protein M3R24_21360 [Chloroflexota bacterium]|nr:hypothetical protein [Chloroflexota bacterium]PLS78732.1 MAG: hypothetical protein CYG59_16960 [Chloroflexota bacterium]
MNQAPPPQREPTVSLEQVAHYLRDKGLATPALILLGIGRPLGLVAGQSLVLLQPLLPHQGWQAEIGRMAAALGDEAAWTRLENLLR